MPGGTCHRYSWTKPGNANRVLPILEAFAEETRQLGETAPLDVSCLSRFLESCKIEQLCHGYSLVIM